MNTGLLVLLIDIVNRAWTFEGFLDVGNLVTESIFCCLNVDLIILCYIY